MFGRFGLCFDAIPLRVTDGPLPLNVKKDLESLRPPKPAAPVRVVCSRVRARVRVQGCKGEGEGEDEGEGEVDGG